jgi:hypothetical protein
MWGDIPAEGWRMRIHLPVPKALASRWGEGFLFAKAQERRFREGESRA